VSEEVSPCWILYKTATPRSRQAQSHNAEVLTSSVASSLIFSLPSLLSLLSGTKVAGVFPMGL